MSIRDKTIREGRIYTPAYITREQFHTFRLLQPYYYFVIVRDLRDTLISAYFSFKISHPLINPRLAERRNKLRSLSIDDSLLYLMEEWLPRCASIQHSWAQDNRNLIHYEELLTNDWEILNEVLINDCRLPISGERLHEVVKLTRFKAITGRNPGDEDISNHFRKGIAGDWKNYFTDKVKKRFKSLYGDLLIRTNYEKDFNW